MSVIDNGLPEIPHPNAEQIAAWDEWVASRPDSVRAICEKLQPWHYYDMPKTGQVVMVRAYSEDGTVRVVVMGDPISTPALIQFEVFGVPPEELVRHDTA